MQKNSYWEKFVSEHRDDWHFDPSKKSQDFTYIGRLETNFKPLLDLMSDDKNFKEYLIVNKNEKHDNELNSRINAFQEWGYNQHNTSSLQITNEEFPKIFEPFTQFAGFGKCKAVALKQYPGHFLPWHEDTYVGFRKEHEISNDVKITRYSIFLEDWKWGHYFLAGNSICHQWKQGDIIELPPKMHHVTCNAGMVPKLTMTVTGTVTDEFLDKKKEGNFKY